MATYNTDRLTVGDNTYVVRDTIDTLHRHYVQSSVTGVAGTSTTQLSTTYDVTDSNVVSYVDGLTISFVLPCSGATFYGSVFQINSLGYKPIVYDINSPIGIRYPAGAQVTMIYNATQTADAYLTKSTKTTITGCWQICDYDSNTTYTPASLGFGYGTCATAEATIAKVVTLSKYALTTGGSVTVKFTYAVPANATLNINSKGAKAIFYKGVAITAGVISAGDVATFIYDGTQYQLLNIDKKNDLEGFGVTATAAELNVLDGITATTTELNYVDGVTSNIQTQLNAKEPADATIIKKANVVDNVTTTTTNVPLSANQGKLLNDRINNLESIGRFLSIWNCTTGKPTSDPTTLPYAYKSGDYYRVGTVGSTNYRPNGSSYTGAASTTQETATVDIGYIYYYDGSIWTLQAGSPEGKVQDVQVDGTSILSGGIANFVSGTTVKTINSTSVLGSGNISTPDTKNTAGSTDTSSKIFLVGATSQAANPQTYSHDTAYVGTDGCLYSGGTKVLTAHQDISGKADKTYVPVVAYGTCATAAATAEKVVTITSTTKFELVVGAIIGVKFSATNTAASNVTLNVNETGAKSIYYDKAVYTSNSTSITGYANRVIYYMYDGTYWCWLNMGALDGNSNTIPSAYCVTAAATAAKTADCTNFTLTANNYGQVLFRYANSAASAITLNINSKGAKPIYINGTASSSSNYTLPAGTYIYFYDGTNFYLRTDGKLTGDITGNAATATKATQDGSGNTITSTYATKAELTAAIGDAIAASY